MVEPRKVQALVYPFQAQGHTLPALMLSRKLAEQGANVTFVTFKDRLTRVRGALASLLEDEDDDGLIRVVALEGLSPPKEWMNSGQHDMEDSVYFFPRQAFEARPAFEKLVEETISAAAAAAGGSDGAVKRCCIISDNLLGWTQDTANKYGIPRYLFYPSPASVLAGVFHVKQLQAAGMLPLRSSPESFTEIPGMPPIRTQEMHTYLLDSAPELGRDFYVSNSLRVHEAAGVLINTFERLEPIPLRALTENEQLNPRRVAVYPVGPLLPRSFMSSLRQRQQAQEGSKQDCEAAGKGGEEEEECIRWLSSKPPRSVLYISFGSIHRLSAEQASEIALGVEASGVSFLWILRGDLLPPGFASRTAERGLVVEDWLPQQRVLCHAATGAFLTHCGWNSTVESVCAGVPLLAMPAFADQALNARAIAELRLGSLLSKGADGLARRHEVAASIQQVMGMGLEGVNQMASCGAEAWSSIALNQLQCFLQSV